MAPLTPSVGLVIRLVEIIKVSMHQTMVRVRYEDMVSERVCWSGFDCWNQPSSYGIPTAYRGFCPVHKRGGTVPEFGMQANTIFIGGLKFRDGPRVCPGAHLWWWQTISRTRLHWRSIPGTLVSSG